MSGGLGPDPRQDRGPRVSPGQSGHNGYASPVHLACSNCLLTIGENVTGTRSMRVEPPDLDPDDAFIARLAHVARHSPRSASRARRSGSWRLLVATGGIAVVTAGGAYAAGVIGPLGPLGPRGPL